METVLSLSPTNIYYIHVYTCNVECTMYMYMYDIIHFVMVYIFGGGGGDSVIPVTHSNLYRPVTMMTYPLEQTISRKCCMP